jgi:hypothetical protein
MLLFSIVLTSSIFNNRKNEKINEKDRRKPSSIIAKKGKILGDNIIVCYPT